MSNENQKSKGFKIKNIEIVEVRELDEIEQIGKIIEASYKYSMQHNAFTFERSENFVEPLLKNYEKNGKVFGAKLEGKFVGTVSYNISTEDKWYYNGDVVNLVCLAVLPEYQNLKIGKMLVQKIMDEAIDFALPIKLKTPEKNIYAIRFYEKIGFKRVRVFFENDHFTVIMLYNNGLFKFNGPQRREYYKRSVLNSMLHHLETDCMQFDLEIQKQWNIDFLPYISNQSPETLEEMAKCYKNLGITPREYVAFNFDNKKPSQRKAFISRCAVKNIENQVKFDTNYRRATTMVEHKNPHAYMHNFSQGYNVYLRVVTFNNGKQSNILFTMLHTINFNEELGKIKSYSIVNRSKGVVDSLLYYDTNRIVARDDKKNTDCLRGIKLHHWKEMKELVLEKADKSSNVFAEWNLIHSKAHGWEITNAFNVPSLEEYQLIRNKGIRNRIEELVGDDLMVKLFENSNIIIPIEPANNEE